MESINRLWKNLRQSTPSNMYTPTVPLTARPNTTPTLQNGTYVPAPLSTRSVSQRAMDPLTIEAKRKRLVDIIGEKNAALENASLTPAAERRSHRGQCAFRDLDPWLSSSDHRVRRSREGRARWVGFLPPSSTFLHPPTLHVLGMQAGRRTNKNIFLWVWFLPSFLHPPTHPKLSSIHQSNPRSIHLSIHPFVHSSCLLFFLYAVYPQRVGDAGTGTIDMSLMPSFSDIGRLHW